MNVGLLAQGKVPQKDNEEIREIVEKRSGRIDEPGNRERKRIRNENESKQKLSYSKNQKISRKLSFRIRPRI